VARAIAAGQTLEQAQATVLMDGYKDGEFYALQRPQNVAGTYRALAAQRWRTSRRPHPDPGSSLCAPIPNVRDQNRQGRRPRSRGSLHTQSARTFPLRTMTSSFGENRWCGGLGAGATGAGAAVVVGSTPKLRGRSWPVVLGVISPLKCFREQG
jgi:hypothetical protein